MKIWYLIIIVAVFGSFYSSTSLQACSNAENKCCGHTVICMNTSEFAQVLFAQNKAPDPKCKTCKGKGTYSTKDKCSTCNGKPKTTSQMNCSTCNGTGKDKGGTGFDAKLIATKCKSCNGKGKIKVTDTCFTCNGTGKRQERCICMIKF